MQDDGTERVIIIEPVLVKEASELKNTCAYKIYKSDDDESFFTEPLLMDSSSSNLADGDNPDYLGTLTLNAGKWSYEGSLLSRAEQQQVAQYIING